MMHSLFLVAHAVTISVSIPGSNANTNSSAPGAFVANFYQFALMIGGILAFGAIVFGGVKYAASAGNPSAQSDAKEWIEGALIGLLLLAGAYLILYTISPQLVNLNLATLNTVPTTTSNPSSNSTNGSYQTASTCQATSNGGSNGTCPNDANGNAQNCCNLYGTAICTTDSCSNLSNLQCQATSNGGTTGSCPRDSNGAAQNCCYDQDDGSAECTTLDCATFSAD